MSLNYTPSPKEACSAITRILNCGEGDKPVEAPVTLATPEFIRSQLEEAGRVVRIDSGTLTFNAAFRLIYPILNRRGRDKYTETIDLLMSHELASKWELNLRADYARRYGPYAARYIENGEAATPQSRLKFFRVFVDYLSVNLAVFPWDTPAGEIWMIDWSDVYIGGGIKTPEKHLLIEGVSGFSP